MLSKQGFKSRVPPCPWAVIAGCIASWMWRPFPSRVFGPNVTNYANNRGVTRHSSHETRHKMGFMRMRRDEIFAQYLQIEIINDTAGAF